MRVPFLILAMAMLVRATSVDDFYVETRSVQITSPSSSTSVTTSEELYVYYTETYVDYLDVYTVSVSKLPFLVMYPSAYLLI